MTKSNGFNCIQMINGSKLLKYSRIEMAKLEDNDLLIQVEYSCYNYKDYLVYEGKEGTRRSYPHTLGIDAAGTVVESKCINFKTGDQVAVMATRMGLSFAGGFSEYVSVPATKVIKIPTYLTARDVMLFGTAGLTAALVISKLVPGLSNCDVKPILVTGGSGGVGIISAIILKLNGYEVAVSTNNSMARSFLKGIGITHFIDRISADKSDRFSLLPERWSACVDVVGGAGLDLVIKSMAQEGKIFNVGSVASQKVNMNLTPLYLRGISLVGINTETLEAAAREELIGKFLKKDVILNISEACSEHKLQEIPNMFLNSFFSENFGRHLFKI